MISFTLTAAGAFQTQELQFYSATYRQVLTGEGLTFFGNVSYGFGRPDLGIEQQFLLYRTKSLYAEGGLSYPVIRARERNLNVAGVFFASDDNGSFFDMPDTPPSTLDRLRGFRLRVDTDSADQTGAINQLYFQFSQGIDGLGSTQNHSDLASRFNGRVDFTKMELTVSRLQPLFDQFSLLVAAYGQMASSPRSWCPNSAATAGACSAAPSIPPSSSPIAASRSSPSCDTIFPCNSKDLPRPSCTASWTTAGFTILPRFLVHSAVWMLPLWGAGLRLGWLNSITADLSVAQVAQGQGLLGTTALPGLLEAGPRKNTRFSSSSPLSCSRTDVAMHPSLRNLLVATTALLALDLAPAAAGPEGGSVVGGAATIQGQGGPAVTVNQSSPSAIINWNTFNIGAKESVNFNQPSSSSVALNRVTGGLGPSQILGTLTANGRIFLINRDGILFGKGAVINTAGFLATTNDIKNEDFMAGRMNFNIPGRPDASIVNRGRITATSGGFAALVAPGVRNSGTITAELGTVALASGNSFTLDMYGDKLITLAVGDHIASKVIDVATGRPLKSLVSNTKNGTLSANGGRVELTAAAARTVVDSVINTRGIIRADSIGSRNGMIVLAAATGASKPAGAPAQTIKIAGTLSAAGKGPGTKGGTIVVSGEHIKLKSAQVDASGRAGGGKVLIGGDWGGGRPNASLVNNQSAALENYTIATATTVSVDGRTTINASATESGHGGKVVLWSDSKTTFAGTILARGGAESGDGGFVEVSSHQLLNYSGTTDTRAPKGSVGTLLLDPENLYVNANGLPPRSDPTASAISADALVNQLVSNNVVLSTLPSGTNAGDILVDANIRWSTGNSLTLMPTTTSYSCRAAR